MSINIRVILSSNQIFLENRRAHIVCFIMVYVLLETIDLFFFPLIASGESEGGEDNAGLLSSSPTSSNPLSNNTVRLGQFLGDICIMEAY
jgi:hypothetical protein